MLVFPQMAIFRLGSRISDKGCVDLDNRFWG